MSSNPRRAAESDSSNLILRTGAANIDTHRQEDSETVLDALPATADLSFRETTYFSHPKRRRPVDVDTSHSRRDMSTGDWTIFAPGREQRPNDFVESDSPLDDHRLIPEVIDHLGAVDPSCPFCRGREENTPEAVWSAKLLPGELSKNRGYSERLSLPETEIVHGDQEGWQVRVVPNRFPAIEAIGDQSALQWISCRSNLFPVKEVAGGHEVVIESSCHAEKLTQMDSTSVYLTLLAYRDRIRSWRNNHGIKYISVFKNCGSAAGASLRHSHSQIIATSLMPHRIRDSVDTC